ncbi:MAG: sugar phosphate isomerase/epimerase [Verrucomicrobiae bacterium]|nr:sugar phosphate isomerase/epimerase [Verrucomicrobiae bacterium]
MQRRDFLRHSLAASAVLSASPISLFAEGGKSSSRFKFCTFTKALQHLDYDSLAEKIAALGFDGIEAPIRPGGHIEPAQVEDELPKMVEALKKHGLELTVMTSGINEVSAEQRTEAVLKTAAGLGIERFRMLYYKYDLAKPIFPQVDEFKPKLRDLVAAAKEIGVKPIYQNHSGKNYFGATVWDLAEVMQEFDPADVGIAFDIGHATTEGSKCWPLHWAVCQSHIDTVYIKEPHWTEPGKPPKVGPLGEGGVDQGFYQTLLKSDFNGPISLHVEYTDHKDPSQEPAFLAAEAKDFATLKGFLKVS